MASDCQHLKGNERKREGEKEKEKEKEKGNRDRVTVTWLLLIGPYQNRNLRIAKKSLRYF